MRKRRLYLNIIASVYKQIMYILLGLIIPRLIISNYGSSVNGLVNSVTQFLGYIAILELGMKSVVASSLYTPLANNDETEISKIMCATKKMYVLIAKSLILYTAIMILVYPVFTKNRFGFWYTTTIILAIAINLLVQYGFGIYNDILLNADQKAYVSDFVNANSVLVNIIVNYFLIYLGASIQVLQIVTSFIYVIRPVISYIYVKKNYKINYNIQYQDKPIRQQKNGIYHHIAFYILQNTDVLILTFFSTLENVSIYTVYLYIVKAVVGIIETTLGSVMSLFGNMFAKNEIQRAKIFFEKYVWAINVCGTILFSATASLIIPFIELYTKGISDADYVKPVFAYTLIIAYGIYILRLPYIQVIYSVGHYKQTQNGAIIEVIINIVLSVTLVQHFGLIGVAVGTAIAMIWRLAHSVWYLSRNILYASPLQFIKNIGLDALVVIINMYVLNYINIRFDNFLCWGIDAARIVIVYGIISIIVHSIFFHNNMLCVKKYIKDTFLKR